MFDVTGCVFVHRELCAFDVALHSVNYILERQPSIHVTAAEKTECYAYIFLWIDLNELK